MRLSVRRVGPFRLDPSSLIRRNRFLPLVLALGTVLGCHSEPSYGFTSTDNNRPISVTFMSTMDITLQTVGPGEYLSPPDVSSDALVFLNVSYVTPANPGGATQRFRFRAAARGVAVVTFRHSERDQVVQDTVTVR